MSKIKMQPLPEGWVWKTLGEIADINPRIDKSKIPDDMQVAFVPMPAVGAGDGHIDVSQLRPAKEVKKGYTPFQEGDVLFAKITPCMENGKMAVVPAVSNGYGFGSTEFHVLRPENSIDARYLYHFVSNTSFRRDSAHSMTGAVGQKRVPLTYLADCSIPLAPLEQQKSIVAEIEKQFSRLDEAVAGLKRIKANLKRYKASVLKAAVEGKLTEEWRKTHSATETGADLLKRILVERKKKWEEKYPGKKYKEPVAPDTSNLPELPQGWVWASIEMVADSLGGYAFKSGDFSDSGHQIVKMANVKMEILDLTQHPSFISNVSDEVVDRYRLIDGDILVTLTGTRKKCDYGYIVRVQAPQHSLLLNQRIARLRSYLKDLSVYLSVALQGEEYRNRFFSHETGNVGQGNVGIKAVTVEAIAIPPLREQRAIITEYEKAISVANNTEKEIDVNLKRAERLRQGILKKAFRMK